MRKYFLSVDGDFYKSEKGVALIITFFVMTIILSIVLGIGAILFIEIKTIRGLGYSVAAFYAADSGIEKTLYYDRKVIPEKEVVEIIEGEEIRRTEQAPRGLCDICNSCSDCQNCEIIGNIEDGCSIQICNDCEISYYSEFNGKEYRVKATIALAGEVSDTILKSFGTYRGTTRGIELVFSGKATDGTTPQAPLIYNALANPISVPFGTIITIFAGITDPDGVDSATTKAYIQNIQEPDIDIPPIVDLENIIGNTYSGTWTGSEGAYYVDITACDTKGNCSWVEDIRGY